jgi:hypothetical protein
VIHVGGEGRKGGWGSKHGLNTAGLRDHRDPDLGTLDLERAEKNEDVQLGPSLTWECPIVGKKGSSLFFAAAAADEFWRVRYDSLAPDPLWRGRDPVHRYFTSAPLSRRSQKEDAPLVLPFGPAGQRSETPPPHARPSLSPPLCGSGTEDVSAAALVVLQFLTKRGRPRL